MKIRSDLGCVDDDKNDAFDRSDIGPDDGNDDDDDDDDDLPLI